MKTKTRYVCQKCGDIESQWVGKCPGCGEWNTLLAESVEKKNVHHAARYQGFSGENAQTPKRFSQVCADETTRIATCFGELDRVLGGGLVVGSVVLLGGDPGVGKSTLLLQALCALSVQHRVLYVSGEESLAQISLRAQRAGCPLDHAYVLAETCMERLLSQAMAHKPRVMVIDSIQTVYSDQVSATPGSVSQVRESAMGLVQYAKQTGTTVFLVGHVTKEGTLAGPRVLEHMVDTVLYLEGERAGRYRLLRAVKNRFGAVNELGVFAMVEQGMREVRNPSALFLSAARHAVPGSVVMVAWEGSRPLLVEVQALVDDSQLGNPRRVGVGFDNSRLALLLAVLHRHGGVQCHQQDIFASVVGGLRVMETAIDLALCFAMVSSFRSRPFPEKWVIFGEVGLTGEIRPVQQGQERLKEAVKHGFTHALVPQANCPNTPIAGLAVEGVATLQSALDIMDKVSI